MQAAEQANYCSSDAYSRGMAGGGSRRGWHRGARDGDGATPDMSADRVQSLPVANASIVPDRIRANTNLTTIMIGERVLEFVRAPP